MERGRIQGRPNFFGYPLLSQEQVKLRTSNFVGTSIGPIGTKPPHCAVIFAIAQLSCFAKLLENNQFRWKIQPRECQVFENC